MKEIPLTQGYVALIDDEDYELVSKYKWHVRVCNTNKYANSNVQKKRTTMSMHRLIMGFPVGLQIDHCDHNGLNNQKSNLRVCTKDENNRNRIIGKNKSSKYKGVCWHKATKKWMSRIKLNKKYIHLGLFTFETEAALAYNNKATELFGEFAYINEIL